MADDIAIAERATFKTMAESTQEDWAKIMASRKQLTADLPGHVLAQLQLLGGDFGGYAVDRLTHSLQSASLAHRAGMNEEYVVCALLHDVGDVLAPRSHAEIAAAILKPFVSGQNHWMLKHHTIFQGYYFFHHLGGDQNFRERFRGHPHFEYTAGFVANYDQNAFDPTYEALPLEAFVPMVQRVFAAGRRHVAAAERS